MTSSKRIIQIGDVHLGLATNPAPNIIDNIRKYIHPVIAKGKIDVFIIGGDLFERLLFYNDPHIDAISLWIAEIITLCQRTDTELIVLEGTPLHDRKQSKALATTHALLGFTDGFKYITELSIEYNQKLGKYILYVPDVIRNSAATTLADVKTMLAARGISRVDIAIMHGAFDHQLVADKHTHSAEEYSQLVKDIIIVNHVHNFSHQGKIVAPGSFDYTDHSNTGQVGGVLVEIGSHIKVSRIINKSPMPFMTYTLTDDNHEFIARAIDELISKYPELCPNIRLTTVLNAQSKAFYASMKKDYPFVKWTIKAIRDELTEKKEVEVLHEYVSVEITEDNIESILADKLSRNNVDKPLQSRLFDLLKEYRYG